MQYKRDAFRNALLVQLRNISNYLQKVTSSFKMGGTKKLQNGSDQ